MSHTKERGKRLQRKWTDVERRIILDYLKKTIKLGYKIEKPNTSSYYNKLIAATNLKNITPLLLKNKVRNLSTKYKDALKWRTETGQRILESEGQTSFESALLTRYPYFYDFDEIWGTKQSTPVPYSVSSSNQIGCKSSLNEWNPTLCTYTQDKEDNDNLEANILSENTFYDWDENHVPNADKSSLSENGLGILHNECANCTKPFGDGIRNTMNLKLESFTTLMFTDFGFASSLEDITNFQAISYIYGVSPTLLEKHIKNHILTLSKQGNDSTFQFSDKNEDDDPLSSFNLTLCQNCSSTLAELYTAFNKFEKLSNKRSIISNGIHLSKINFNCQEIKLEDLCEVANGKNGNIFNEINYDNSEGEEFQQDSIKEEELAWEFNDLNSNDNICGEETNYNFGDDDFDNCVPMETENNQNKPSIGIATRKSKRKSAHVQIKIPSNEEDYEYEDLCVSSKGNYSPEGSDYSNEKTNYPLEKRRKTSIEAEERERMKGFRVKIIGETNIKSTQARQCFRCGKRIEFYYRKKLHELIHKLDIPNLQKEILEGRESICPKCGFEFKSGRFHGPLRLKTHCLKEHNLIVAKCVGELETFTQYLISEKNYCDKNQINQNISPNEHVLNDILDQPSCKTTLPVKKTNKSMRQLKIHNTENEQVFRYYSPRCIACGIYYPHFKKLKRHFRLNHNIIWKDSTSFEKWMDICEEQSYNCDICDEFFVSKGELEIHLIVHNNDKDEITESSEIIQGPPFQCPNCKDSSNCYKNWTQLQLHGYKVHKVKFKNHLLINNPRFQTNYFCKDCDVPFVVRLAWVTHMRNVHHQVVCESCCENFSNEQLLQLHVSTIHVGQKAKANTLEYNCKNCNQIFPNVKSLWLHTFVHIAEENSGNIEKQCFETFASPLINCTFEELTDGNDIFSTRYSDVLSVGGDIFSCVRCLKKFKSHHTMKIHHFAYTITDFDKLERRNIVGRQFQCPICKFDCKRNIILREHCLLKHNTIVSTESYSAEQFIKELHHEKENCAKLLSSRREAVTNSKSTKAFYCFRCGKRIDLYYRRKLHQLIHLLDIPNLEKQMIEGHGTPGSESICPKCGINFKCNKYNGPLRLKTHCLEKHNLIVYRSLSELEKFTGYLISENNYCNTNQNNGNIKLKKQTLANKLPMIKKIASEEDESNNAPTSHLKDNGVTENISLDGENNQTILSTNTEALEDEQTPIPAVIQENLSEMSPAEKAEFLTCQVCGVSTFGTVKGKHLHFVRHFEVKSMKVEMVPGPPFICPQCFNVQSTLPSLREHCILAHGFNVNTYSKRPATTNQNNPARHNKIKTSISKNGDKFICDLCGKVLKSYEGLREHKITHDSERKLICDKCGASFKQMKLFRYHKRLHFERDTGVRPSCNICKKRFVTSKGVMKHKRNYHSTKERRTCPICNRTFSSLDYAHKHIRKHGENS